MSRRAPRIMAGAFFLRMFLPICAAQERPRVAPPSHSQPLEVAQQKQEGRGGRQEISIHGNWTIVVRNADGSTASRHEFENKFIGSTPLNDLLAHHASNPVWFVDIVGPTAAWFLNQSPTQAPNSVPLDVSIPASGTYAGKLVLSGSVPGIHGGQPSFPVATQLSVVETALKVTCASNFTCANSGFSARDLTVAVPPATTPPPPITVQPGQGIDVTVVFSFQ
jgi:hypothetical protein